uniref:Acetyl-CoA acetyltransferase (AtoB) n=1 Tax=uncultured marine thaumarchaeote KM3_74_C10 TaxID=1456270 RepID=A0A075HML0_9ARCH|nr:acetyl-CoA acetyltransferase (atoB) [uncultured marine thaumarchaeote KM3_74_C10]
MRVFSAGVGFTRVGDHWTKSLVDLAEEAAVKSLKSSGITAPDFIIVGNMFSAISSRQEHLGALIADTLGLSGTPAYKVEGACASGGVALNAANALVKSGEADSVLVVGVEKMRDIEPGEVARALSMAENAEYTQFLGASFVSLNAMLTRLYLEEYSVSLESLAAFPVLAHRNAMTADHAQFRKAITPQDVARSLPVSDPVRILDCAPVGDGAAATVLVGENILPDCKSPAAELVSSSVATNRFSFYEREDMVDFSATKKACQNAIEKAGLTLSDIDFVEVHDAFSVVAALALESMGFSERGHAAVEGTSGAFDLDGKLPINTFGGLKGRGHPVGATGVYQFCEAYLQLTGQAKLNQVHNPKIGLAHNMGGIDTTTVVHLLRRMDD